MSYRFFQNKECAYFKCKDAEKLNCIFCYCPIYLYEDCGGNYIVLDNGVKDCSKCLLPHSDNGYDYIIQFIKNKNKKP